MRPIAGVMLVAGLLGWTACVPREKERIVPPKTYAFTILFDPTTGCPQSSVPGVLGTCGPGKPECLKIYGNDHVKFMAGSPGDPKYAITFALASQLTTVADPSFNDGKHWDLRIGADAPKNVEHKFTVIAPEKCPSKPLDPTIIIMP